MPKPWWRSAKRTEGFLRLSFVYYFATKTEVFVYRYICIYMYVCMYCFIYVCMYTCMYENTGACACGYIRVCECMGVLKNVVLCAFIRINKR